MVDTAGNGGQTVFQAGKHIGDGTVGEGVGADAEDMVDVRRILILSADRQRLRPHHYETDKTSQKASKAKSFHENLL